MTVTPKSHEVEIADLQRLLLSLGLMKFNDTTRGGHWGNETQEAVIALYEELGWDHDPKGQWVTASAMVAIMGVRAAEQAAAIAAAVGGGGSHAGGGGSHAGGGGSHAGGGGSHAGGGGSHAGGGGSHAGGGGSHAGGGGSHAG